MAFRLFIFIFMFMGWGLEARSQEPQDLSAPPEQWQLTLDVIKSKAQTLVIENNGLQGQYRQLIDEAQQLQEAIDDQQAKNGQLSSFIKERHGRTDQQLRMDELNNIVRLKNLQARTYDEQLENLQRKKTDLDNKINQLKYTISGIQLHQQSGQEKLDAAKAIPAPEADDQLGQLHQQIEDASKQEVLLENELNGLKTGDKTKNLDADAIEEENRQLEARLDVLRLQKLRQEKDNSDKRVSQASARMINVLKMRKEQLEIKIYAYESRLDDLRQSSLMAMSWPLKKKRLVHEMVQLDAHNLQLHSKVKMLREDIDLLRDQVAKLERRLNFANEHRQNISY